MLLKSPDYASLEAIELAVAEMVRPPERLTVSQAATKYRKLDNPGSYVGDWPNEKTPYLVEPMDTLNSIEHTGMIFVGPARTGKSDMCLNWIGHTSICDPADMLIVHMTQNTARDWSMKELRRLFRHSPDIGAKVAPGRHNQNVHDVRFSSGMNILIKWPSITELSGKTVPRGWLMDYDRMPLDVDGEGPAYDLTAKRGQTFGRFAMTAAESSPGYDIEDPKWLPSSPHEAPPAKGILELYNRGDRRRYYWRCPFCKHAFEPTFKLLNYPNSLDHMEAVEAVTMTCPHCDVDIEPSFKNEMNVGGRWLKEGQLWLPDDTVRGVGRRSKIASFWMKGPAAAFQDWKSLVYNFLQAEEAYEKTGDEGPLKKTVNTDQGEPYSPKALEAARLPEELKDRATDWGGSEDEPVVPVGVRFLVATIDVQAGSRKKFVVQVHGISENGDMSIVDMYMIRKSARIDEDGERHLLDPSSHPEDWRVLVDEVIEKSYPLADGSGRRMQIKQTACDSGGEEGVTPNAYAFWRWLRDEHPAGHHRRFQLVKGEPSSKAPRIRLGYPDSNRKDRHSGARGDVPVLFINSNMVKDMAAGILGRDGSSSENILAFGMAHFPKWAKDWLYVQLTAEVRTAKGWENPRRKRNEAWDLLVYCIAICLHQPIKIERLDWQNAPGWALDWDDNDLVFDPGTKSSAFNVSEKVDYDLSELASALA